MFQNSQFNFNSNNNLRHLIGIAIFLLIVLGWKMALVVILIFLVVYLFKQYKDKPRMVNGVYNSKNMFENFKRNFLISIALFFGVIVLFASFTVIDAGTIGIYSFFGEVKDEVYHPGFHFVNPLVDIIPMSVRTEEYTMSRVSNEGKKAGDDSISALTKEGLSVSLDITALYRVEPSRAAEIYKTLGLEYEEKVIRPGIRSAIREVIAQYEAKDIYSEKRGEANDKIFNTLKKSLGERGIIVEQVLLRDVALPENLAHTISEKLQAEQEAQKYDFVLQKEKKEADRKRIEAAGQRDAQKIINESLSTNYLYYQYINTLKDRQGTIYVPTSPTTGMPTFKELGK